MGLDRTTILMWMHNGNVETIRAFKKEADAHEAAITLVREQRVLLDEGSSEGMSDEELLENWASVSGGDDIQQFPVDVE